MHRLHTLPEDHRAHARSRQGTLDRVAGIYHHLIAIDYQQEIARLDQQRPLGRAHHQKVPAIPTNYRSLVKAPVVPAAPLLPALHRLHLYLRGHRLRLIGQNVGGCHRKRELTRTPKRDRGVQDTLLRKLMRHRTLARATVHRHPLGSSQ